MAFQYSARRAASRSRFIPAAAGVDGAGLALPVTRIRLVLRRVRVRLSSPDWLVRRSGTGMDILGIGTDIIECPRIGKMIEQHGELFLRRVYTEREIRYCQSRKHAIEHFAGRWAAKEAILKALGTGWSRGIAWTDIEVRYGFDGQPRVLVCGG